MYGPLLLVGWVLSRLSQPRGSRQGSVVRTSEHSITLALVCWTGLGGKERCEELGLELQSFFHLVIGSANIGKCEKDGFFFFFFKACLVCQGGGRSSGLLSASRQGVWTSARVAVPGVPSNRDARAGCSGTGNQRVAQAALWA